MNWDVISDWERGSQENTSQSDLDKIYAHVFGSEEGRKVLTDLCAKTIEQPTWYPGEEASHGFAREGQNSIVRMIEERIKRARK